MLAIGGEDGVAGGVSVEAWDLDQQDWQPLPPLARPCLPNGVLSIDNTVIVLQTGGA